MSDIGLETVTWLFKDMQIDEEWSVQEERGFTWWGKDRAQRVWSEPPFQDGDLTISWIRAESEFLQDVPDDEVAHTSLNHVAKAATFSRLVRHGQEPRRLKLVTRVHVHESIRPWCSHLISLACVGQASEAHWLAEHAAESSRSTASISAHPRSGTRPVPDEMLYFPQNLATLPEPATLGREELPRLAEHLQHPPCVLANGDENGCVAEFPFNVADAWNATSLVRVYPGESATWGRGTQFELKLPISCSPTGATGMNAALDLNEEEVASGRGFPQLGSWCVDDGDLIWRAFMPNVIVRAGMLQQLTAYTMLRARWVAENVYGDDWESGYKVASRLHVLRMALMALPAEEARMRELAGAALSAWKDSRPRLREIQYPDGLLEALKKYRDVRSESQT